MQVVLTQLELKDALSSKILKTWMDEQQKMANQEVLSQIELHLSDDIHSDIRKETSASELWSKLEEICIGKIITYLNLTK